ncbi:hypothetical protein [Streptomyces chartreusis]|uniref:hypothetical protein n=1 Tax=Streptomyces chartreusis TaxID=1969 RepID=UPI0033AE608B
MHRVVHTDVTGTDVRTAPRRDATRRGEMIIRTQAWSRAWQDAAQVAEELGTM